MAIDIERTRFEQYATDGFFKIDAFADHSVGRAMLDDVVEIGIGVQHAGVVVRRQLWRWQVVAKSHGAQGVLGQPQRAGVALGLGRIVHGADHPADAFDLRGR